jgi:hypothetical protein
MRDALLDLKVHTHPAMGNKYDFAPDWSRNWFASIGYNQLNPARSSSPCSGPTNSPLSKKAWKRWF